MITDIFITGILPEPVLLYAFFALFFIIVLIVYRFVLKRLKAIAVRTETKLDDFLIRLFRFPAIWLIFWFSLKLFNHLFITKLPEFEIIIKINNILLVLSFGWIVIQLVISRSMWKRHVCVSWPCISRLPVTYVFWSRF